MLHPERPEPKPYPPPPDPLGRGVDLQGLSSRLAALDTERARRPAAEAVPELDISTAQEAQEACRRALQDAEPGWQVALESALRDREAALETLASETNLKLRAAGQPDLLRQGLRRLEAAAYQDRSFPNPGAVLVGEAAAQALARFDAAFASAQAAARQLLQRHLGLEMMPDQTGAPLRADWHNVIGSEITDNPRRDNTVAREEAPGWLLHGEVLVPADVIRYAASTGGAPLLADLKALEQDIDLSNFSNFGRKRPDA